jgi:hypothetical protein
MYDNNNNDDTNQRESRNVGHCGTYMLWDKNARNGLCRANETTIGSNDLPIDHANHDGCMV